MALVTGALAVSSVSFASPGGDRAAGPRGSGAEPPSAEQRQKFREEFRKRRPSCEQVKKRMAEFTDAVAAKAGITGGALRDAIEEVRKERIDAAVDKGRLSREQANEIKRRMESGQCPPMGRRHFRPGGPGFGGPGGPPSGPPPGAGPGDGG